MESTLKLPKPWLSYSAINLWNKDKEQFRARYYRNEKLPDTPFSLFGRRVHNLLENDEGLKHIPRLKEKEVKLETVVEGIPVLGYIDAMDSKRRFIDYKSGIRTSSGDPRWNIYEVQKLDQLPFYSLLIHENYSNAPKDHPSKLIWLETQWKPTNYQVGSQTLEGEGNELELTGHHEVFDRVIEEWERERMKNFIVENAKEISEDYKAYIS